MDLILIVGSGAVGKMTVGQELMKITDYRLFHNHMMIEPVIDIFGQFNGAIVNKLRDLIFDEFIASDNVGIIFTYMMAFDLPSEWDYIKYLTEKFEASGGTVYFVELVADQAVRLKRNRTENRLANKASKRNLEVSEGRLIREDSKYRLVSNEGEVPFEHYIKIDNTYMEPSEAAEIIKKYFGFSDKKSDIYKRMRLDSVLENEIEILHNMQVESFMPLYEKYHDDEFSPAKESLDRIKTKWSWEDRTYLFILYEGMRVGAICVANKDPEDKTIFTISPIFVLPKFQNSGIGYAAMQCLFAMYPQASKWKLDTILQEEGNCKFYEKCGFVQTGVTHEILEGMTLVDYEKSMK